MMNMKKRIMSLALLLAAVIEINAQEMESPVGKFSVIPHVGVGISNWSKYQAENENPDKSTTLEGYDNIHVNLDYIQVPLKVRAYITRNLSLTLGVQAGFLCGDGKWKMDYTQVTIRNEEVTAKETETKTHTWPAKKLDVSIPIGVSYEYMGVILSAQYNLGLTNVSDAPKAVDKSCKNKGFGVSVGYRFTL